MRESRPARRRRRGRAPLAALLLAAGLARGADTVPPAHWHLGTLDLGACPVGAAHAGWLPSQAAWCTTFEVPENWDDPAGRRIGLHVAVVRGAAAETEPDMLAFLDGGPGGAATQDYPAIAAALAPLRKRHHILLIDQRGTGDSNALDCSDDISLEADKPTHAPAGHAPPADAQRAAVARCLATLAAHADPRFYATGDAVRDLEAVRQALGGVPLDLLGVSYGTRVAQQYAARYPAAVRTMVLDSPVPNRLALMSEHARNLEEALRRRLDLCSSGVACAKRFGDSYDTLMRTRRRLQARPQAVELHDPQSFALANATFGAADLAELVRFYLYSDTTSALLPLAIADAAAGRYAPVLAQAQLVVGDVTGHLSSGMAATVLCTEDADLLRENPADEDTLLGGGAVRSAIATCGQWPHRARAADFHRPFTGDLPVLVLSGEFDPVTPARYGAEIVAGLAHGRQLVAPGQGHAVIGAGCMPRLVSAFVEQRDAARLDDGCLRALGASPAFLDVNGAAP